MKKLLQLGLLLSLSALPYASEGQGMLKKLKDKANNALDKALGNEVEKKTGLPTGDSQQSGNNSGNSGSSGRPANKGGAGLTNTTPPDVKTMMGDAETAQRAGKLSEARFAVQQALQGVEIQLGREVLQSLPSSVQGMDASKEDDKVMSMGWGWSNLTIQRSYRNTADKYMTLTIGNAGIYSGLAALYLANNNMMQTTDNQPNMKQVRVKGNKGVITYEDRKGYGLVIQLGQSTGMVWECVNFDTEQQVMDAANAIDIDRIKKILGEQ